MGGEGLVVMIESDLPDFPDCVSNEPSVDEEVSKKFSTVDEDIRGHLETMMVEIRTVHLYLEDLSPANVRLQHSFEL